MPAFANKKALALRAQAKNRHTDTAAMFDECERQMVTEEWEDNIDEYLAIVIQCKSHSTPAVRASRASVPRGPDWRRGPLVGYVTMFSTVFPLAPLFAYLNNIWEIRVDAGKLVYFFRKVTRPLAPRGSGGGGSVR
jgi:hypothetical protein